jgi:uncharacterized membrane protein YbhN (UPF0104 family)
MNCLITISGKNIKTSNLIRMNLIARFYQLALPNIISALYKLNFIKIKTNYKISAVVLTFENILKSFIFILFGIIGILYFDLLDFVLDRIFNNLNAVYIILFFILCLVFALILKKKKIGKILRYKKKYQNNYYLILVLIVSIPLFIWSGHYLVISSIGNKISLLSSIFISSLLICLSLIPFIIQGSGIRELILFYILNQLVIDNEYLYMIPFVFYVNFFIYGVIGGILSFVKK